ncbi:MAG: SprB repeat-containing protein, partial [Bacteroidota bacterium]
MPWNKNHTSDDLEYNINVTDANGCPAVNSATILQPTALTMITAVTNPTCFGICNGTAAAIVGGGTPGYTYLWNPGLQTTSSIAGQCAGSYPVTATDLNGCTLSATVIITQPTQVFANPSVLTNISCAGVVPCDGSATSAATGGTGAYVYDWTPGSPAGDGTPTITGLCAGTYNLTVTDANLCSSTMPVTITQPLVLSAPITGSTSSCNICNGTATVTPTGGTGPWTFLWMPTGQTTATAVGLCPNITYTVTVTDANGCVATIMVTILQTITISITTSITTLSCFGACYRVANANAAGLTLPYSFIWTGPSGIVSLGPVAAGLCAGTYTVNVSDAAGCFNSDSVTFVNPPILTVSATNTNLTCGAVCNGTGTATPVGGTGAYTYSWNTVPVQTTQTATGLCAGTYIVTVTDASGCTANTSITVLGPTLVVDNVAITDANCLSSDGAITVAPTGGTPGYTYNWGPGAPTGDGTPTITNLFAGAYTLAITDASGCVFNFNYLVNNIAGPTLVMSQTNISCFGVCDGTATGTASAGAGGYVYDWTPGAPTGDLTPTITALCGTQTYTLQVT